MEDDQIYRNRRVSIQNSSKGRSGFGAATIFGRGFRTLDAFPFRLSLFRFPNTPPPPPPLHRRPGPLRVVYDEIDRHDKHGSFEMVGKKLERIKNTSTTTTIAAQVSPVISGLALYTHTNRIPT